MLDRPDGGPGIKAPRTSTYERMCLVFRSPSILTLGVDGEGVVCESRGNAVSIVSIWSQVGGRVSPYDGGSITLSTRWNRNGLHIHGTLATMPILAEI